MGNLNDSVLFTRKENTGTIVLFLYVDDIIIIDDDFVGIEDLKKVLCEHFKMKDLGLQSSFLGLEVLSSNDGLFISQTKYIFDLVSRA